MTETTEEQLASPERRAFFRRITGRPKQDVPVSLYPRPPWALGNKEFLAQCSRCNACIESCPNRVLRSSGEEHPVLNGLPVLDLSYGSCDFCGLCVDACKSGVLNKEQGLKRQVIPSLAGTCQAEMGFYCDLCADACPIDAIKVSGSSKPVLAIDKCTGCGECALSCFSNVLVMVKSSN